MFYFDKIFRDFKLYETISKDLFVFSFKQHLNYFIFMH
jgi:hypothetical protein